MSNYVYERQQTQYGGANAASDKASVQASQNYKSSAEAELQAAQAYLARQVAADEKAAAAKTEAAKQAESDAASEDFSWITGPGEQPVAAAEETTDSASDETAVKTRFETPEVYKDPAQITGSVTNKVTEAMETPIGGQAALKAGTALSRLGRDEYGFSSNRIENICGYVTYLRKACGDKGLFLAKIKQGGT